jgi:hypothetical protein
MERFASSATKRRLSEQLQNGRQHLALCTGVRRPGIVGAAAARLKQASHREAEFVHPAGPGVWIMTVL